MMVVVVVMMMMMVVMMSSIAVQDWKDLTSGSTACCSY